MLKDPAQKAWADAVYINFPNQADRGAHVNVSGVAMTKYAKNKAEAQQLMGSWPATPPSTCMRT